MFARRTRGLFEFLMTLLCLWAALYHTPMGAFVRRGMAKVFGVRTSARPLLAYFSGGATPHPGDRVLVVPEPPAFVGQSAITPALALGLGLKAALHQLPEDRRRPVQDLARLSGLDPAKLWDGTEGAATSATLLARTAERLGSEDAAVLAIFAGLEPARYAADRCRAEGMDAPTLEALARHLPPGFEDAVGEASDALAFGTAYGLAWPVPERTPVTSGFGVRIHPILGTKRLHTGVDLGIPAGSAVRVTADGVVRRASEDGVNGRVLIIDHGRGVTTAYCHNSVLLVQVGDVVRRGQVIARSGNTGRSTGPHLHYQLELHDQPVDPFAFRSHRASGTPGVVSVRGSD
ncbi:MAG: M23 family metallopeptidase [Myxococcaceae bacterium]|nr:M23 family metallopeptidase [Myxococcaceae bacterium]